MSIEVEATNMLMNLGERAELLDGTLCCLQYLALHTLRLAWNVLYLGGLQRFVDQPPCTGQHHHAFLTGVVLLDTHAQQDFLPTGADMLTGGDIYSH